jgi:5,10-methylenetetrahydromethanopterin reductase
MRIGINATNLMVTPDLGGLVADAAATEAEGFSSWWLAQTGLVDALGIIDAAAAGTATLEMGTAVVPTWPRHPQVLAGQALTTQAITGGRLVLGIGLAHQPSVEDRWVMKWEKPIRHMLDYLAVLEDLLNTGKASYRGEVWSFVGEANRPTDDPPSVMLAALGEQMLRIAGRRTDGTLLWCVGPRTLERQIVPTITEAASAAGRRPPRVVCCLPVAVTDDPAGTRERIAQTLTIYGQLPSYRAMLDIEGVEGPADISLVGSEDEVRAGLAEIAAAGATDFTAFVFGATAEDRARTRSLLAAADV